MPFPTTASPPALFPTYLVPSLPFRRRHSSTSTARSGSISSTLSSSPPSSFASASTPQEEGDEPPYLTTHTSHLRCARCAADLAHASQIISKGFTGRHGRAYLVSAASPPTGPFLPSSTTSANARKPATIAALNAHLPNLPNTHVHRPVPRTLVTGAHTVGDLSCAHCGSVLGWKYVAAEEEGQRYKVGKFILETKRVCRSSTWEGEAEPVRATQEGEGWATTTTTTMQEAVEEEEEEWNEEEGEGPVEFDSQDEDECEDLFLGLWTPQLARKRRLRKKFVLMEEED